MSKGERRTAAGRPTGRTRFSGWDASSRGSRRSMPRFRRGRRILPSEKESDAIEEVQQILDTLSREDATFRARATAVFSRPAYEVPSDHELPQLLAASVKRVGVDARITGASFWTDAAVLGHAGIPSILFGPGGAGLHSTEEYVNIADVLVCRDALEELARRF